MKYSCPGLILIMILMCAFSSYSQGHHPEHEHTVRDAGHTWHIGLGLSAAKMAGEQGMEPGIHVHLLWKLGNESNWSLGMGYEGLKGENWHSGLNALLNYRPLEFFSLNAGPGIVFEKADAKNEVQRSFTHPFFSRISHRFWDVIRATMKTVPKNDFPSVYFVQHFVVLGL